MGYETKLIFVKEGEYERKRTKTDKDGGWRQVIATISLYKCAYETQIGKLHERVSKYTQKTAKWKKELMGKLSSLYGDREQIGTGDIECDQEEIKELNDDIENTEEKLAKSKLLYIYEGDNKQYEDSYGDLLMTLPVKDVKHAIIRTQAKWLEEEDETETYDCFDAAIRMCEAFEGKNIRVILWGE